MGCGKSAPSVHESVDSCGHPSSPVTPLKDVNEVSQTTVECDTAEVITDREPNGTDRGGKISTPHSSKSVKSNRSVETARSSGSQRSKATAPSAEASLIHEKVNQSMEPSVDAPGLKYIPPETSDSFPDFQSVSPAAVAETSEIDTENTKRKRDKLESKEVSGGNVNKDDNTSYVSFCNLFEELDSVGVVSEERPVGTDGNKSSSAESLAQGDNGALVDTSACGGNDQPTLVNQYESVTAKQPDLDTEGNGETNESCTTAFQERTTSALTERKSGECTPQADDRSDQHYTNGSCDEESSLTADKADKRVSAKEEETPATTTSSDATPSPSSYTPAASRANLERVSIQSAAITITDLLSDSDIEADAPCSLAASSAGLVIPSAKRRATKSAIQNENRQQQPLESQTGHGEQNIKEAELNGSASSQNRELTGLPLTSADEYSNSSSVGGMTGSTHKVTKDEPVFSTGYHYGSTPSLGTLFDDFLCYSGEWMYSSSDSKFAAVNNSDQPNSSVSYTAVKKTGEPIITFKPCEHEYTDGNVTFPCENNYLKTVKNESEEEEGKDRVVDVQTLGTEDILDQHQCSNSFVAEAEECSDPLSMSAILEAGDVQPHSSILGNSDNNSKTDEGEGCVCQDSTKLRIQLNSAARARKLFNFLESNKSTSSVLQSETDNPPLANNMLEVEENLASMINNSKSYSNSVSELIDNDTVELISHVGFTNNVAQLSSDVLQSKLLSIEQLATEAATAALENKDNDLAGLEQVEEGEECATAEFLKKEPSVAECGSPTESDGSEAGSRSEERQVLSPDWSVQTFSTTDGLSEIPLKTFSSAGDTSLADPNIQSELNRLAVVEGLQYSEHSTILDTTHEDGLVDTDPEKNFADTDINSGELFLEDVQHNNTRVCATGATGKNLQSPASATPGHCRKVVTFSDNVAHIGRAEQEDNIGNPENEAQEQVSSPGIKNPESYPAPSVSVNLGQVPNDLPSASVTSEQQECSKGNSSQPGCSIESGLQGESLSQLQSADFSNKGNGLDESFCVSGATGRLKTPRARQRQVGAGNRSSRTGTPSSDTSLLNSPNPARLERVTSSTDTRADLKVKISLSKEKLQELQQPTHAFRIASSGPYDDSVSKTDSEGDKSALVSF